MSSRGIDKTTLTQLEGWKDIQMSREMDIRIFHNILVLFLDTLPYLKKSRTCPNWNWLFYLGTGSRYQLKDLTRHNTNGLALKLFKTRRNWSHIYTGVVSCVFVIENASDIGHLTWLIVNAATNRIDKSMEPRKTHVYRCQLRLCKWSLKKRNKIYFVGVSKQRLTTWQPWNILIE